MAIYNVNKDTGDITETAGKYGSSNSVFYGTIAQWNALTTEQKKTYDHASIPDSLDGNVTFPASKVMLNSGDSVEEKIGNVRMTNLWENPSPTSSFAAQNITLSSSDYDLLLILYAWTTSNGTLSNIVKNSSGFVLSAGLPSSSGSRNMVRHGSFTSATVINFTDATDSVGASASATNNSRCIPLVIYGIKLT